MPVMVVGADSETGRGIVERFLGPDREVRAFVTDLAAAEQLRRAGAKVALGDVSDDSHVAAACLNCFSVVLVCDAATDSRERSFASTAGEVMDGWVKAVQSAGVHRVIWVVPDKDAPATEISEVAVVDISQPDLVDVVFECDRVASL